MAAQVNTSIEAQRQSTVERVKAEATPPTGDNIPVSGVVVRAWAENGSRRASSPTRKMRIQDDAGWKVNCTVPACFAGEFAALAGRRVEFTATVATNRRHPGLGFATRLRNAQLI